jgi:hypothetical protein
MKKILLIAVAALFSGAAFAQTTTPVAATPADTRTPTEKAQMKDLRQDERAYDNKKAEAKHAINKGYIAAAKTDLAAEKADKQDIKADAKTLKSEGVKHPVKLAAKQIKRGDEKGVRTEIAAVKTERVDEQKAVKAGDITAAQADQKALRADRADLKKDIREARRDGIKHPIRRAR